MISFKTFLNLCEDYSPLYHYTDIKGAINILNSNTLKSGSGRCGTICLTRNKNMHKSALGFKLDQSKLDTVKRWGVPTGISFELNGESLRHNNKIKPYNALQNKQESEERIVGSGEIPFIKKHITKIRVHQKLDPATLSQLKSHGIPVELNN